MSMNKALPFLPLLLFGSFGFCSTAEQSPLKLSKDEQSVVDLTNSERKKADLSSLRVDPKLMAAARGHALNMAKQDKLPHDLDGKSMTDRIKAEGYEPS